MAIRHQDIESRDARPLCRRATAGRDSLRFSLYERRGSDVIVVKVITKDDDLEQVVDEINSASWDDANEMSKYCAESLSNYLDHQGTLFVACHEVGERGRTLLGMAAARLEVKPNGGKRWLYVDEVDVCADQRRKGAGRSIMQKLINIAEEAECEEVWLGAEASNQGANALYRSLEPDEVTQVVGYTYEVRDGSCPRAV